MILAEIIRVLLFHRSGSDFSKLQLQPTYGKVPHLLLLASSRAPLAKMAISGIRNRLKKLCNF